MEEVSMQRHGHAKQLVVFFGAASIGTGGGWGADAVLRACCKVVCRPRGTDQRRGRVVLVDEHRTTQVSSAVNGQQPSPTGPTQQPGSHTGNSFRARAQHSPPAERSKCTKAEPAAEPIKGKGKGKGKAAKAKPAPQPGRWLDRDCNAALNMQRIGESRWRPLELYYWPEQVSFYVNPPCKEQLDRRKTTRPEGWKPPAGQVDLCLMRQPGASRLTMKCIGETEWLLLELCSWPDLLAKGKEYPGLGYKRLRDNPPKAQQQQQPAEAQ
ncbi:hypothetical protein QJQ45_004810 [Haematococcus lacustris]|nr:hypothetical protein QJQ45_004810 [Haematococcus lacustris]